MNTSNRAGPSRLTKTGSIEAEKIPRLEDYSSEELTRAETWPAIQRYLALVEKAPTSPSDQLRILRHELWLRATLATFHDRAPAKDVCEFWSDAAEALIKRAWNLSGCASAGYALLALGKLGSRELNLSSDVDLIVVRPDEAPSDSKRLREFQSLLSDYTEFGYCLRVDLTLRPGGRMSAAIPSLSEFEHYYGYQGETWERLAYVRMRVIEGPRELSEAITTFARKFSFRRHLDYTLIDDLKSLRAKIRREKYESRPGAFHLKLGEGGIRELELFVHAVQVIHGGRNPGPQTHSTTLALERIRTLQLLPGSECEFLLKSYWHMRTIENKIQGYEDQQTYLIDLAGGHPALGPGSSQELEDLRTTCLQVTMITSTLIGESEDTPDFPDTIEEQCEWLKDRGFSTISCDETWPALLAATALSRKSEQDEKARLVFLRGFLMKLAEIGLDRDLGLSVLLDFVRAIRAKASFFTLLNRESRVRDELAMLFSISPYLASLLTSRPELIDEFIYRSLPEPSRDPNLLLDDLAERKLLAELISATQFLNDQDLQKLMMNLTSNADAICSILLERLCEEYGPCRLSLVALGKWGGRELGLRSDLDFIFVTPEAPTAGDHKAAKRFLSRITEPHRGGSIYSVDMRLRPSGHAGPIMVSASDLHEYLSSRAAAWERQAYLRARTFTDLHFHPAEVSAKRGLEDDDVRALREIRSRLFKPSLPGELDLKLTNGGLADVEFTAQISLLSRREFSLDPSTSGMVQYLEGVDARWKDVGPEIREHYGSLRSIEQLFQLTTSLSGSKMRVKSDEFRRLSLVLERSPLELETSIRDRFAAVAALLEEVRTLR